MTDPKNIIPAIDLLMKAKKRKGWPTWIAPLDFILTTSYLSLFGYFIYKVIELWLM